MPKSANAAFTLARVLLTFNRLAMGIANVCLFLLKRVPASLASDVFAEIQTLVDGQADGEVGVSC
jgi:hypothetical protein